MISNPSVKNKIINNSSSYIFCLQEINNNKIRLHLTQKSRLQRYRISRLQRTIRHPRCDNSADVSISRPPRLPTSNPTKAPGALPSDVWRESSADSMLKRLLRNACLRRRSIASLRREHRGFMSLDVCNSSKGSLTSALVKPSLNKHTCWNFCHNITWLRGFLIYMPKIRENRKECNTYATAFITWKLLYDICTVVVKINDGALFFNPSHGFHEF